MWDFGKFPEFGAIFMSNTKTREECFRRSLFALPLPFAEFVRKVRVGMLLFLFDYQDKKLYGVFEAVSDGGLNIVPHAYTSSHKSFPAQVRFRIIWKCYPLREHEFGHAIRDNYYTEHKFNFGLSKDQVQRLLHLFESRRVDIKKFPYEVKIKDSNFDHSGGKKIKLRHSDDSINQESSVEQNTVCTRNCNSIFFSKPDSGNTENFALLSDKASEIECCLIDPSALEKSISSKSLKDIKSVDISSNAPLELGDFIPLVSPEHCNPTEIMATNHGSSGLFRAQSALSFSNDDDFPKHHLRVKAMYSDRIEETKSVFARLEDREKCASMNNGNILQRKNIHSGMHKIPQRRKIPKVAKVFSRLTFNSERNKQEKDISKEKNRRRRGGCSKCYGNAKKNYLNIPPEMFDNRGDAVDSTDRILFYKGMQEAQPCMNAKPEGKTDSVIEDKRYNHSPVSNFLSDIQKKKRILVWPTLRAESKNAGFCGSYLDDQVNDCENTTIETISKSLQLTLSRIPFKADAMRYLEHISEQNQGQQKCEEKDTLLSFCAAEMIDMADNQKQCLQDMATKINFLLEGHDNSDDRKAWEPERHELSSKGTDSL